MKSSKADRALAKELCEMLAERFAGIDIEIGPSERWDRKCVTFTWPGFAGLLPEERFHRLATVIPESFREERMKGLVWMELAPGESVENVLAMPRCEDVADRAADIYVGLCKVEFFPALSQSLAPSPEKKCGGNFATVESILADKDYPESEIVDAKLLFIQHGAYCDCQVVVTVQPELAETYADVA